MSYQVYGSGNLSSNPTYAKYSTQRDSLLEEQKRLMGEFDKTPKIGGQELALSGVQAILPMLIGALISGGRGAGIGAETGAQASQLYLKGIEEKGGRAKQRIKEKIDANKASLDELSDQTRALEMKAFDADNTVARDAYLEEGRDRRSRSTNAATRDAAKIGAQVSERERLLGRAQSDKELQDAIRVHHSLAAVKPMLHDRNVVSDRALRAQVARMYEEGRLTDEDVARYIPETLKSYAVRITNFLRSGTDAEIDDDTMDALRETLAHAEYNASQTIIGKRKEYMNFYRGGFLPEKTLKDMVGNIGRTAMNAKNRNYGRGVKRQSKAGVGVQKLADEFGRNATAPFENAYDRTESTEVVIDNYMDENGNLDLDAYERAYEEAEYQKQRGRITIGR